MSKKLYTEEQMREAMRLCFSDDPKEINRYLAALPAVQPHGVQSVEKNYSGYRLEMNHALRMIEYGDTTKAEESIRKAIALMEDCDDHGSGATPPPSDQVREAVDQINIADKLIRFDSDDPLWVRISMALEALQAALAALSDKGETQ